MSKTQHFINGEWVDSISGATRTIICPANGEFVAEVAEGGKADVEKAILAAREAFEAGAWSGVAASKRGDFLIKVAEEIERR